LIVVAVGCLGQSFWLWFALGGRFWLPVHGLSFWLLVVKAVVASAFLLDSFYDSTAGSGGRGGFHISLGLLLDAALGHHSWPSILAIALGSRSGLSFLALALGWLFIFCGVVCSTLSISLLGLFSRSWLLLSALAFSSTLSCSLFSCSWISLWLSLLALALSFRFQLKLGLLSHLLLLDLALALTLDHGCLALPVQPSYLGF